MRLTSLFLRRLFAVMGMILLTSNLVLAQSGVATADLSGSVQDETGAVVPGATVTLRNVETNIERTSESNGEGRYQFSAIPPATYELSASATNFNKVVIPTVTLTVGQSASLDLTLKVGIGDVIDVVADAEIVETQRTSVASTVNKTSIDNLPINGRRFLDFSLTTSTLVRDNAPTIGPAPTAGLNAGGQRARSNNITIDGADNNDNSVNAVRGTVSQEAVQEFQIITNSYAPEFGRASGAVVNIITRGGTNDYHGNAFGFFRHRSFQANNAFAISENPAFTRAQYGATLGGPIKKDKTFFFFALEQSRRQETAFSIVGRDPSIFGFTDAQRAFAGEANVLTAFGLTDPFLGSLGIPGLSQALLGPLQGPLTLLRGDASSGLFGAVAQSLAVAQTGFNPVLNGRIFPTGTAIPSTYVPLGGIDPSTGFPLNGEFPISESTTQTSIRVDHQFNINNNFNLRYNFVPSDATGLQSNAQNQVFGQNAFGRTARSETRDHAIVASNITTFEGGYINEARFQFAYRKSKYEPESNSVGVNINGVGYFGREPFSATNRTEKRTQFQDNFSILKGSHSIKIGGDYNFIPVAAEFQLNFGGVYNFGSLPGSAFFSPGTAGAGVYTLIVNGVTAALVNAGFPQDASRTAALAIGNRIVTSVPGVTPVQAYGLGIPQNFLQGFGDPTSKFRNTQTSIFGQDSWRIRPNFTLNYGVRYDVETPPTFAADPNCPDCGPAEAALGVQQGIPRDYNNVQPRVAIAYDPFNDSKTVIRAAYGLFYDHPLLAIGFNSNVADGAQAPQLLLDPGTATTVFQGTSTLPGYIAGEQRFNPGVFPGQGALLPFTLPIKTDFEYAYAEQVNLTVEREIFSDYSASVGYLFVRGLHQNRPHDINEPNAALLIRNRDRAVAAGLVPAGTSPFTVNPTDVQGALAAGVVPAALFNFFRPSGPNFILGQRFGLSPAQLTGIAGALGLPLGYGVNVPFGPVIAQESSGTSSYHGLTADLKKRFTHNFQFLASYTWSHAIDNSTDLQTLLAPQQSDRLDLEKASSAFDQRHRFVLSGVYLSPYKWQDTGFYKKALAGMTFAPILELSSGRPFNIYTGVDTNLNLSDQTDRPNVLAPGDSAPAGVKVFENEFGRFYLPKEGEFGNLGRNTGVRPGYASVDFRLTRRLPLTERVNLELIGEVFNLFNRVNVSDVNNNYTVAGIRTAASDPRQFQFAAKFSF